MRLRWFMGCSFSCIVILNDRSPVTGASWGTDQISRDYEQMILTACAYITDSGFIGAMPVRLSLPVPSRLPDPKSTEGSVLILFASGSLMLC